MISWRTASRVGMKQYNGLAHSVYNSQYLNKPGEVACAHNAASSHKTAIRHRAQLMWNPKPIVLTGKSLKTGSRIQREEPAPRRQRGIGRFTSLRYWLHIITITIVLRNSTANVIQLSSCQCLQIIH